MLTAQNMVRNFWSSVARILIVFILAGVPQTFAQCDGCGQTCSCDSSGCSCGHGGCASDFGCLSCADLMCRDRLCGDLYGFRPCLANHGISVDSRFTQFYQGVTSGGRDEDFQYGGKLESIYALQGEKLGLHGLTAFMHVESSMGQNVNSAASSLAFPNTNLLWPLPDETEASITQLFVNQLLTDKCALTIGKYNGLDLFNMLYPSQGRGIDGFMNANFLLPITLLRTVPLSFNGGGILGMHGQQIQTAVLVYDTQNSSTTVAPNLFDQGSIVLGYHRFFTKFGGLDGSQGFLGNYSNRTYASTDPLSYTVIPGEGIVAGRETGSWSLAYFADQLLYVDPCNCNRTVRFFGQLGLADKTTSPYAWTGTVSLQGTGLNRCRPMDTMGVGYFYNGLSSDYKDLVSAGPLPDIQDIQGVELYYNATITPWFHLTTDLQVIENEYVSDDTAVVLGLRATIDL